ncbi:MAG: tRNA pseudouridine(55) synthase TruB, partial [Lachnospiraceae bacterium]|nr:tRNA pseudouridine(55) synthase TruB [Lachnospiraceae bacterium]
GKATKVCELLSDRDKTYQAVCRLGVVTDTQDMTGNILEESSFQEISEEQLERTAASFLGESFQIPPMYSAIKIDGKRLYELAREGKTVKREPRRICISSIELLQVDLEEGTFMMEVTCSKGTYIRTLCHDIGQKLGVGAAMESLVRIRVGEFFAENAFTLARIESLAKENPEELLKHIYPIDTLFRGYPKYQIEEAYESQLSNGNFLEENQIKPFFDEKSPAEASLGGKERLQEKEIQGRILLYDLEGNFKAIYERVNDKIRVVKMF